MNRTYNYNDSENLEPEPDEPATTNTNRMFWLTVVAASTLLTLFGVVLFG
jgi:hypothetical protein